MRNHVRYTLCLIQGDFVLKTYTIAVLKLIDQFILGGDLKQSMFDFLCCSKAHYFGSHWDAFGISEKALFFLLFHCVPDVIFASVCDWDLSLLELFNE